MVSSSNTCDIYVINDCNQQEADTRIILQVQDAVTKGSQSVIIRTVDTDVVVVAIYVFYKSHDLKKVWIAFGTGNSFKNIAVLDIASSLGTFTGCDTTSSFAGTGKKRAWEAWNSLPLISDYS